MELRDLDAPAPGGSGRPAQTPPPQRRPGLQADPSAQALGHPLPAAPPARRAALTRGVGSMPTLYAVRVIVGGWIVQATWEPLRRVDAYPFPFLLFLNSVLQLLLHLGRAAL
jgi:hypothetical protein